MAHAVFVCTQQSAKTQVMSQENTRLKAKGSEVWSERKNMTCTVARITAMHKSQTASVCVLERGITHRKPPIDLHRLQCFNCLQVPKKHSCLRQPHHHHDGDEEAAVVHVREALEILLSCPICRGCPIPLDGAWVFDRRHRDEAEECAKLWRWW
jgi:hypothetical protein